MGPITRFVVRSIITGPKLCSISINPNIRTFPQNYSLTKNKINNNVETCEYLVLLVTLNLLD